MRRQLPGQLPGLAGMQNVLGLLQFVTAVVAVFVPLAAAIYLLVTVTWTLGQRLVLRRLYPAVPPTMPPALAWSLFPCITRKACPMK